MWLICHLRLVRLTNLKFYHIEHPLTNLAEEKSNVLLIRVLPASSYSKVDSQLIGNLYLELFNEEKNMVVDAFHSCPSLVHHSL